MYRIPLAFALVTLSAPLAAQTSPQVTNDLTFDMVPRQYRICNDRPARPTWIDEVQPREAYKAIALMELYEIRAWETIVASGDCECEIRFPAWDGAEAAYQKQNASLSQAEHTVLRRNLINIRKQLEPKVRLICEAQGNW